MTRNCLPNRRAADAISFEHSGRAWTATFGRTAEGHLAEVFRDAPKTSPLADAAREAAILTSLALQHGCTVETILHALDGRDAGPIGAALRIIDGQFQSDGYGA